MQNASRGITLWVCVPTNQQAKECVCSYKIPAKINKKISLYGEALVAKEHNSRPPRRDQHSVCSCCNVHLVPMNKSCQCVRVRSQCRIKPSSMNYRLFQDVCGPCTNGRYADVSMNLSMHHPSQRSTPLTGEIKRLVAPYASITHPTQEMGCVILGKGENML